MASLSVIVYAGPHCSGNATPAAVGNCLSMRIDSFAVNCPDTDSNSVGTGRHQYF